MKPFLFVCKLMIENMSSSEIGTIPISSLKPEALVFLLQLVNA